MGGGVIRAAAKVGGFSMPLVGIRSVAAERFPVPSVTQRAATLRPATSTVEEMKLVASNSEGSIQRPSSAVDDWVFAGEEEGAMVSAADSMPRVVFGGVPSLQEAKEATSELTDALEKTYLSSSTSTESEGSTADEYEFDLHRSNVQIVEANHARSDFSIAPALPSPAITAFKFLKENPVAQNVVASVACDPNVWNAVLQNKELQGFLLSQRTCLASSDVNLTARLVEESNILDEPSEEAINNNSAEDGKPGSARGFVDILEKIKGVVVDMMSGLSNFFVNLFGGKGADGVSADSNGAGGLSANTVMEASFMGLAVMAILVIVLKRV